MLKIKPTICLSDVFLLKNWSIVARGSNGYVPPELIVPCLCGRVYGNPSFKDGDRVQTSQIISVKKRLIITKSGSVYYLDGPPAEKYLVYLQDNGFTFDAENPVKCNRQILVQKNKKILN